MKIANYVAFMFVASVLAGPAIASESLTPHRAEYNAKISVASATLNTELQKTETGYVARHIVQPAGMSKMFTRGTMDVTSAFDQGDDGIRPVTFRAVDTIRKEPEVNLSFDWDENQASGTVGTEEVLLQLDGLSHDSVSLQYQLMHDLLNGNAADEYVLFDVDKMHVATVTHAGSKRITTKAGKFDAVGIRHQKEGSSRTTTMWFVETLDYLPVLIEQHRKGKLNFKATLVSYTPSET